MPYTPEQVRAYLESFKELRENIALGRTPPSIWDLPIPAEGEPLPKPNDLRRIDRMIRVVESELAQIVVYEQLVALDAPSRG